MAKRTRGSHRPGQRRADRRGHGKFQPHPARRPAPILSEDEESQAAELESEILAQERDAEATRARARERRRSDEDVRPARSSGTGLLAAKAAEEYGYVVRDVRRIIVVASAMAAFLAVLYVLVDVAHVVKLT